MHFDVSIVIINYNGLKYLHELFCSLASMDKNDLKVEVVFVDNQSVDGSIEYINEHVKNIPHLKIVQNLNNEGFANGNNIGVDNASGEYVVLLNNDTKVEKDWLINLYECHTRNNAGISTSKLLFFNNFLKLQASTQDKFTINSTYRVNDIEKEIPSKFCKNVLHHGTEIVCFGHSEIYLPIESTEQNLEFTFTTAQLHNPESDILSIYGTSANFSNKDCKLQMDMSFTPSVALVQNAGSDINEHFNGFDIGFGEEDNGQYDKEAERNLACGAAMMIKRDLFISLGGFDKNFFAYYEDTDLSFRVRKAGYKIIYAANAVVRHVHTGTSKEWSPFFVFLVTRNKLWFLLKNISFTTFCRFYFSELYTFFSELLFLKQPKAILFAKLKSLTSCFIKIPYYTIK